MTKYKGHYKESAKRALEPKRSKLVAIAESGDFGIHSVRIDVPNRRYIICLAAGKTEADVPDDIRERLQKAAGKTPVLYGYGGGKGANHIPDFGVRAH